MKKRLFSSVFACLLAISLIGTAVPAYDELTSGEISYKQEDDLLGSGLEEISADPDLVEEENNLLLQEDAEIMADVYVDGMKKDTVTLAYSEEFTEGRRKEDLIDQGEEYEGSSYVFIGSYTLPGKGKYLFVPRAKLKDGRTGEPDYSMQYSWDEKYGWVSEQIFNE